MIFSPIANFGDHPLLTYYYAGGITFTIIDKVVLLILTRSNPNNTGP